LIKKFYGRTSTTKEYIVNFYMKKYETLTISLSYPTE